jgi:hypothetical protein
MTTPGDLKLLISEVTPTNHKQGYVDIQRIRGVAGDVNSQTSIQTSLLRASRRSNAIWVESIEF